MKIGDLVDNINNGMIGETHAHLVQQATAYLQQLRTAGGLEGSSPTRPIPWVLDQLFLLTSIQDTVDLKLKLKALDSLLDLLRKDDFTNAELGQGLVKLALGLMEKLKGDSIQTEIPQVQQKLGKACGLTIENILRHYESRHLNAVLETLQTTLFEICSTLSRLNTQNNPEVDFAVEYTLEGAKRLQTDANQLLQTLQRIGSAFKSLTDFYNKDIAGGLTELFKAVQGLDKKIPFPWYGSVYFFGKWIPFAKKEIRYLERMQEVYRGTFEKIGAPDWKSTYHYIDVLFLIVKEGETANIQQKAFEFLSKLGDCELFKKENNLVRTVTQFAKFKPADVNTVIRQHTAERLVELRNTSWDEEIVQAAQDKLKLMLGVEEQNLNDSRLVEIEKPKTASTGLKKVFSKEKKGEEFETLAILSEQQRFVDFLEKNILQNVKTQIQNPPQPPVHQKIAFMQPGKKIGMQTSFTQVSGVTENPFGVLPKLSELNPPVSLVCKPPTREPHPIFITLATAFGVSPQWLERSGFLITGMGIGATKNTIKLYNGSLEDVILPFVKAHPNEIHFLDLCFIERIEGEITDETAGPLAELLRDHPSIELVLPTPDTYSAVGLALKRLGQFELAIKYYTKGIDLAPDDPMVSRLYARRSYAYSDGFGDTKIALQDAEKGWKISQQQCQYSGSALITLYTDYKQYSKSVEIAYAVHALDREDPMNIYNLAASISDCPANLKELEYANRLYNECLTIKPDYTNAKIALGNLPAKIEYWRQHGIT